MPNSTLPGDNELGDGEITTGDYQTKINQLATWVNALQSELNALSSTTLGEASVRSVNGGSGPLRANLEPTDEVQFSRITDAASPGDGDFDSDKLGYWEATVELGGDFDAGVYANVVRIGNVVSLVIFSSNSSNISVGHANDSSASSSIGALPNWARVSTPGFNLANDLSSGGLAEWTVDENGGILVTHYDWNGNLANQTSVASISCSYPVL